LITSSNEVNLETLKWTIFCALIVVESAWSSKSASLGVISLAPNGKKGFRKGDQPENPFDAARIQRFTIVEVFHMNCAKFASHLQIWLVASRRSYYPPRHQSRSEINSGTKYAVIIAARAPSAMPGLSRLLSAAVNGI
jgi:hypothetical protein